MGVEPTTACSQQPVTDFEDRGAHRNALTPICEHSPAGDARQAGDEGKEQRFGAKARRGQGNTKDQARSAVRPSSAQT